MPLLQRRPWLPLQSNVVTPFKPEFEAEAALRCHPATPAPGITGIGVRVCWCGPDRLGLRYEVAGDADALVLPAARPAQFADRLWEHTCFEAFILTEQGSYCELNFSPSTQWAIYCFSAYRKDMARAEVTAPPVITTRSGSGRITVEALADLTGIAGTSATPARMALSAVIEAPDGTRSYWALAHPAPKPDFHHPDAFTLPWRHPPAANQGTP